MRLLCLDVENTTTSIAVFDDDRLARQWSVSTDARRTADEWGLLISGLLEAAFPAPVFPGVAVPGAVEGVCICSAVPSVLRVLRALLSDAFATVPRVVLGPGVKTGLPVLMDNPREVGTDRIANAVAALEMVGPPCVVVDLGTATTFDVVGTKGAYVGGVIAPGLHTSLEALGHHGAQLRQVEIAKPRAVIAKNTVEALQAGAVYGCAGQIDGIVGRIARELGTALDNLTVIATGALAASVVGECETVTRHEPHLTLQGLRIVFARNV